MDQDQDAATAAIDELLDRAPDRVVEAGQSVHLHCTDADGEWIVRVSEDGTASVMRQHAKGDAAIRGPAHDLLLVLRHERPLETVEVIGDHAVAARFVARMRVN